jgi:hypothetical protein
MVHHQATQLVLVVDWVARALLLMLLIAIWRVLLVKVNSVTLLVSMGSDEYDWIRYIWL